MSDPDPLNADFARARPEAFARVLARGDLEDVLAILQRLPTDLIARVVARLPGAQILAILDAAVVHPEEWLAKASFDDAVSLMSRVPTDRRLALINSVSDGKRRQQLLRQQRYPAHSVGALTRDVACRIGFDTPVGAALETLAALGETEPGSIVLVDRDGDYRGCVDVFRVATAARGSRRTGDYALDIEPLRPETPIAVAAEETQFSTVNWLPVVDHRGRILGCVSRAGLLRAAGADARGARGPQHLLMDVLSDAALGLAALLDTAFSRRTRT